MNTGVVREQAARIDAVTSDLRTVDASLERIIAELGGQWQGSDLARFRGWWRDQHKPALHGLVDSIEGLAHSARHNADEQDRASENGAASDSSLVKPDVRQGAVDYGRVARGVIAVQAALDPGGIGVTRTDLRTIAAVVATLNPEERSLLFEQLKDSELAILKDQMQESTLKGGMTLDEQSKFLGNLLPSLTPEQARRLMGSGWVWQSDPTAVAAAANGADLVGGIFDDMRGPFDPQKQRYGDALIAGDEIEVRSLDNGAYIVVLPGVQDLSQGLKEAVGAAAAGRVVSAGAAAAAGVALWAEWEGANDVDSARDMKYARQSEMQPGRNGSIDGTNAYAFAVKEAMRAAGIPDGADVMIVGHSFGAYTAAELATDPTFNDAVAGAASGHSVNVTHVAAAGADVAFRMNDLPHGTSGILLNNSHDAAYIGERALPANNESSSREIVFDGSRHPDRAGKVNDGAGHQPTNYGAYVRRGTDPMLKGFNESAFDRYGGEGRSVRVAVRDPYR